MLTFKHWSPLGSSIAIPLWNSTSYLNSSPSSILLTQVCIELVSCTQACLSISLSHRHTLPLGKVRVWQLAGIDQLVFPLCFLNSHLYKFLFSNFLFLWFQPTWFSTPFLTPWYSRSQLMTFGRLANNWMKSSLPWSPSTSPRAPSLKEFLASQAAFASSNQALVLQPTYQSNPLIWNCVVWCYPTLTPNSLLMQIQRSS